MSSFSAFRKNEDSYCSSNGLALLAVRNKRILAQFRRNTPWLEGSGKHGLRLATAMSNSGQFLVLKAASTSK